MNNRRRPVKLSHNKSWFRIENSIGRATTVRLYDEIGSFGVSANEFVKELDDIEGDLTVMINSPGGEVFDGIAIFHALQARDGNVEVVIDGLAASAATIVAMAGDTVKIAKHAQMMIHESHAVGVGNAKDMRQLADLLDKCSDTIANTYADKAGGTTAEWRARMGNETWFTADEAVKAGLADEVIPGRKVRNDWNLTIFNYAGREKAPDPFAEVVRDAPVVDLTGEMDDMSMPKKKMPDKKPDKDMSMMLSVGDRVQVKGSPHEPGQTSGTVAVVQPGPAYGVKFDSGTDDDMDAVHRWYVGDELTTVAAGVMDALALPDIAGVIRAVHEIRFDPALFRAAVQIGLNDVPAPDPPKPPAPAEEPLLAIDLPAVRRALKEAAL